MTTKANGRLSRQNTFSKETIKYAAFRNFYLLCKSFVTFICEMIIKETYMMKNIPKYIRARNKKQIENYFHIMKYCKRRIMNYML